MCLVSHRKLNNRREYLKRAENLLYSAVGSVGNPFFETPCKELCAIASVLVFLARSQFILIAKTL